jgi:hypothetical protein
LQPFFPRCVVFAPVNPLKPFGIGKDILGIFKAETFMIPFVFSFLSSSHSMPTSFMV